MVIPDGEFRYEIRRAGELIATEEESLAAGNIHGVRHLASGSNVYEVEAELDPDAGEIPGIPPAPWQLGSLARETERTMAARYPPRS